MAVSQIEYKILGRLARQTEPWNHILSQALYQMLGLSIQLNPRLIKASRLRKLDVTRDTKSLQLYHHIIWLAREGLSITEVYILPFCQNGGSGPECRVMAAKLRASLYHVFCLFHNQPAINSISPGSGGTGSSSSAGRTKERKKTHLSPSKSPREGRETKESRRRGGKSSLRDPTPSMTSETSYITNPYAGHAVTPPTPSPPGPPPPVPIDARTTPTRPPGLAPINISPTRAAASFLLPPLNFVPMAREHFGVAQHLADSLLSPTNALRLCVSLDNAMFLWECEKNYERARRLARVTIKSVYTSAEGLDDEEFADAAALVQVLGGIVKRDSGRASSPQTSKQRSTSPGSRQEVSRAPRIDRTIAVSPPAAKGTRIPQPSSSHTAQHAQSRRKHSRTPDRLSTVPEVDSTGAASDPQTVGAISPPASRMSSRSRQRRKSSTATSTSGRDSKAEKRRKVEQAEEMHRKNSEASRTSSRGSRQATPPEGYVRSSQPSRHEQRPRKREGGEQVMYSNSKTSARRREVKP